MRQMVIHYFFFSESKLSSIVYRQWSPKNHHFMVGAEFANNDSGRVDFFNEIASEQHSERLLKNKLDECLLLFNYQVPWCQRVFSSTIVPQVSKTDKIIDYLDILNSNDDFQIVAPPQFGLTSFARYLAMKAEVIMKEKWAYLDMLTDCTYSNLETRLRQSCKEMDFDLPSLKGVIIDNWSGVIKNRQKILDKLKQLIQGVRIILLTNVADSEVIAGIDTEESHNGFKLYYMQQLSRSSLRTLVEAFNKDYNISDDNLLLDRLVADIEGLNEHRTPQNCMQLLMAYRYAFERHPINRSRVLELVLDTVFKNSETLYYNDVLNEKDCCQIMSVIAYELYISELYVFTYDKLSKILEKELPLKYTSDQIKDLLNILTKNQILEYSSQEYRFRFIYWLYYFVAYRIYASDRCFEEMMARGNHIYNSDIVEFYTAFNDKSDKLVEIIVDRLNKLTVRVRNNIGRPFWNPYEELKWNMNESTKGKTTEQVANEVSASRLPDDIKDSVKDLNYNAVKPYNQSIQRVFEEYEVKNLMNLARAASRALRNCHLVDSALLIQMRNAVYEAWGELFKVIILISPALAKTGYGGYGGANFKLQGNFSEEFYECIKQIVCAIPYNIINWYKDDFFSEKRVAMYHDAMINYNNPIIRHLNARIIVECRPKNWKKYINEYIATLGKNTYFLGDIYSTLRHCYAIDSMSEDDLRITKNLILVCYTKHKNGGVLPSYQQASKNIGNISFPKRLSD